MKLKDLKCISNNVSLDNYYWLYNEVRNNMQYPEWLGIIPRIETENILKNNGNIWVYYDNNVPVCSIKR